MSGEKLIDCTTQADWVPGRDDAPAGPCIGFGSSPPYNGYWNVGDTIYNESVASNAPSGWICTVAGTPGTWVTLPENVNVNSFEDTFARADGALDPARYITGRVASTGWVEDNGILINSNALYVSTSGAVQVAAFKGSRNRNCDISFKISTAGSGSYVYLVLRFNPETNTALVFTMQVGAQSWWFQQLRNGVNTVFTNNNASTNWAVNDVVRATFDGTDYKLYKNGSLVVSRADNLDAKYHDIGYQGVAIYNGGTSPRIQNLVITDI